MPKAEYLKLFAGDTSAMVALFTSDQGWIENIPAQRAFNGDAFESLAHEQMHSIRELSITQLNPKFIAQYTDHTPETTEAPATPTRPVPIGKIITNISKEMNIPPDQSKIFTAELFKRMHNHLKSGRSLDSVFASVKATDTTPSSWSIHFKEAG